MIALATVCALAFGASLVGGDEQPLKLQKFEIWRCSTDAHNAQWNI